MCGIAGLLELAGPTTPADIAAVQRMMDAQVHRGPDDSGPYHDEHALLGSRRLAILDLSDSGREPMSNEDGTVQGVQSSPPAHEPASDLGDPCAVLQGFSGTVTRLRR